MSGSPLGDRGPGLEEDRGQQMEMAAQPGQAGTEGRAVQRYGEGQPGRQANEAKSPAPVGEEPQHEANGPGRPGQTQAPAVAGSVHSGTGHPRLDPDQPWLILQSIEKLRDLIELKGGEIGAAAPGSTVRADG